MLYDPKWEAKTKPAVMSLAGLIAWLEQQPPETEYNWWNTNGCLVCNYLRAVTGTKRPSGQFLFEKVFETPSDYGKVAGDEPWTYGAALERARALASRS
jgi:hypothetical protein